VQLELEAGQYRNAADKERRERMELKRQKNAAVLHSLTQGPKKIMFVKTQLFSMNCFRRDVLREFETLCCHCPY
jgi:hypothetical protein